MKELLKDRSFFLTILLTVTFLGTGIFFLLIGLADYSWLLFILLPLVLGVALGALPNKKHILWVALITTFFLLIAIVIPGWSGMLCVVLTFPIIIPFIFLGYVISHLYKRYHQIKGSKNLPVLLLPLLPFLLATPAEHYFKQEKEKIIEVKTEEVFHYSAEQVYDAIKSVDTLNAEKPFLMFFDLPIPTKCVLEKEEIGGLRICYFKSGESSRNDFGSGTIVERITEMERGKVLKMDVIDYQLVGRNWLGFKEAIYYFTALPNNQCKLTRITTYTSVLNPRFYWQPLEVLGIEQEHEYVFNNLRKDLEMQFGKKN